MVKAPELDELWDIFTWVRLLCFLPPNTYYISYCLFMKQ